MKRTITFLICLVSLTATTAYAQVTIGSDNPPASAALLELKTQEPGIVNHVTDDSNITSTSGGLLLPRVKLVSLSSLEPFIPGATTEQKLKHAGLIVHNLSTTGGLQQATYQWDGSQWRIFAMDAENNFYLPSFNLSLAAGIGNSDTIDLYSIYEKQYKGQSGKFVSSDASITRVPTVYTADKLAFLVLDYDDSVITVDKIEGSIMHYTIKSIEPSQDSYINILCVIRK